MQDYTVPKTEKVLVETPASSKTSPSKADWVDGELAKNTRYRATLKATPQQQCAKILAWLAKVEQSL